MEKHGVHHVQVSKMYKDGKAVTKEESSEHSIEVRVHSDRENLAKVGAQSSITINMGNFESVKVQVSVELPCYVEELKDAFETAKQFVDIHLNEEVKAVKDYRASKENSK